jgi:hypothetical protein
VTCITFGGFALLDHFVSYLKHLLAPEPAAARLHQPITF